MLRKCLSFPGCIKRRNNRGALTSFGFQYKKLRNFFPKFGVLHISKFRTFKKLCSVQLIANYSCSTSNNFERKHVNLIGIPALLFSVKIQKLLKSKLWPYVYDLAAIFRQNKHSRSVF